MSPVTRASALTDISLRPARIGAGAAIALVWVLVGITFWANPESIIRSQAGHSSEPWAHIFNALYILGGVAVLAGRWRNRGILGAESLGVCLLAAGWMMNAVVVWTLQGVDLRSCTYLVFTWWAFTRYRSIEGRA